MDKKKKLLIVGVILFFLTIGVSAATILYTANNVSYSSSSLSGNNVKDALDNLVSKCESASTTCPSGMTCTNKSNIKCRRATSLHTATCRTTHCVETGYSDGATMTFGNKTTIEGVLATGDAFDCDVNGDGTFNQTNERFYYVSDYFDTSTQNFNDKYAVLIYYSNVKNGVASTAGSHYDSSKKSYNGPVAAKLDLPTTSQWSNISLYKQTRRILTSSNETTLQGNNLPTSFSYSGYAARLLTFQEAYKGCNSFNVRPSSISGLDKKCQFLLERLFYSDYNLSINEVWLENPHVSSEGCTIDSANRMLSSLTAYSSTSYNSGTRPVIEVLKSQISY